MNDQDTNAETIDAGFHPASNCWVREVKLIFWECFCILRKDGIFLGDYDPGIHRLPFDSLKNPDQRKRLERSESGMQFSHTLEEQISGQLEAGFVLTDLFEDYNEDGKLAECHVLSFVAARAVKPQK